MKGTGEAEAVESDYLATPNGTQSWHTSWEFWLCLKKLKTTWKPCLNELTSCVVLWDQVSDDSNLENSLLSDCESLENVNKNITLLSHLEH